MPVPDPIFPRPEQKAGARGFSDRTRFVWTQIGLYVMALVATLGTLWLRMFFAAVIGDAPLLVLFLLPIMLSAYVGGLGPGLLSTAVAGAGVAYFFLPKINSFLFERPIDFIQWLALMVAGVLISVLIESLHRARRALIDPVVPVKTHDTERKIRIGFALALICLGVIGIVSFLSIAQLREDAALLRRTDQVLACLHGVLSTVTDAETAQRGYTITGEGSYLDPYRVAEFTVEDNMRTLRKLTAGRAESGEFASLEPLVKDRMIYLTREIELRRREGFAAAQAMTLTGEGKKRHDLIRQAVAAEISREEERLRQREAHAAHSSAITRGVIVAGGLLAFVVVAVALFAATQDFAGSRRAEAALLEAHDRLEARVKERTAELERRNDALSESEGRYRDLTQLSPHAIFINRDNRIIFVNEAGVKFFRATSAGQILGRSPLEFFHPDSLELVRSRIAHLLVKPRSVRRVEEKMIVADGTLIEAEVSAASFVDAGQLVIQVVCQDITERKQAELASAHLAAIVASSEDAIIGKNLDSVVTSWNRGAESMFGYTAAEMIGRSITVLIPGDRRDEEEKAIIERIRRGETLGHFETVRVRKDGVAIEVSVAISAIKDGAGRVVGASKVARDITEAKKAARTLLSERDFSAAVIDSLPGVLYLYDQGGKFLRWNKNFERVSGYTGEEIAAMHPLEFFAGEDRELVAARIAEVFAEGQSHAEADFVAKDGSRTPYYFTGRKITLDGKACLVGVGIDVTARRKSESEVRLLADRLTYATDAARIGVWDWNIKANTWYVTPMYFTMLGFDPSKGFDPWETWIDRVHPDDRPQVEAKVALVLSGAEPAYFYQARMALADGSYRWFQVIGRVLSTDEAGRPGRLIGVRIDISESKLKEAEIHALNLDLERRVAERTEQLEAANKELEAFSYSVSHDLRAPLRSVDGFSQAVLEDYGDQLPADGRRHLQTIRKGAQQMGELIDDLLKFARLSRATLEMEKVSMDRLVRLAAADLQGQFDGGRMELRLGNLPPCRGDPALLRQVWVNLLSNAYKYSGRREKAVIEVGAREEAGRGAVYFVRDNGAGFDMRYADKLFGVFQRLHRAEDYEGTGVGLAIVQRIVHRHRGKIWAEGAEDRGATFYFTLGNQSLS